MDETSLLLRRATESDVEAIISLIDEAAGWLRAHKDTDQWAEPWPTEEDRRQRIVTSLRAERTWILWDRELPVATLTAEPSHEQYDGLVWPEEAQKEAAVYVCRLVVRRTYAGRGLGAALLDWAGHRARESHNARWLRVDVWTTNEALHAYYVTQGFDFFGYSELANVYPSAALFQKPTDEIGRPEISVDEPSGHLGTAPEGLDSQ